MAPLNEADWEDVSEEDSDWEDVSSSGPTTKEPGMLSKMAQGASTALDIYGRSQKYSPQDWMNRTDQAIRSGANKAGEFVAEEAGRAGFNPNVAAGMGTFMQMTPDLIESAVLPSNEMPGSKSLLRPISRPLARRSLGLTKRFLNTPFARGKAAQAADVALDQEIIPVMGSPKVAMGRAVDLQEKSGQALGSMREAAGRNPIDPVFDSLEAARQRATGGMKGGAWDTVHRKFDEAQETLLGLLNDGPEVALSKVEQAKKLLSNTVNWIADNVSQETAKQISGSIESGVESIMRSKGIDMTEYAAQKGLYGASKTMQKGLANELAAQAGNNAVSLPTMVAGAGQLATGNPMGAAATLGIVEGLRRRGAGASARLIDAAGRIPGREPGYAFGAVQSLLNSANPRRESFLRPRKLLKNPKRSPQDSRNPSNNAVAYPDNYRNEQGDQNNNNRDFQSQLNHTSPNRILGRKRETKVLSEQDARRYLKAARQRFPNDETRARNQARLMAQADGFTISR